VDVRTLGLWWAFLVVYGIIAFAAIGAVLDRATSAGGRIVSGASALGIVVFLVHGRGAGVRAEHRGVTVRRYLGPARFVEWPTVAGFEPVASRRGGVHVAVRLHDGSQLTSQGAVVFSGVKLAGYLTDLEYARPAD
jgi:hypothetical protein